MRATRTPACARRAAAPALPAAGARRGRTAAPPQRVAPGRSAVRLRFVPPNGVRDYLNLHCGRGRSGRTGGACGGDSAPRHTPDRSPLPPPPRNTQPPPPTALPAALTAAMDAVRSCVSPLLASPAGAAAVVGAVVIALAIKKVLDTPSRTYDPANPNVGSEYDAWTK